MHETPAFEADYKLAIFRLHDRKRRNEDANDQARHTQTGNRFNDEIRHHHVVFHQVHENLRPYSLV
ncbi:hypothetical protein EOS_08475 [Caballeronia mineralivorans PML1(12)]|uniref:Uncharacterized protein n=1 Tax=Caballeronia mineralivorans PML1(12) TaxID=908627 RepID=A0A0J1D227_9BURK|nr:hypothetical protein EOS_08475 [Caballeronia mineralivorans PML1(12)]